jgi:argininosuccinate lyase
MMNETVAHTAPAGSPTASKVSGFLREAAAPEIQEGLLRPALERGFAPSLPLIEAINKAHLLMLADKGIVSADAARLIARTILDLEAEGPAAFEVDPAREDPYFNYEAELIHRAGPDVGGRLHTARSRNDLKCTLDRMRARAKALDLMRRVLELRSALLDKARDNLSVVMPGYTHMQPAQPITFGWYLLGIEHAIGRDHDRLVECYARINLSPLGAGAMAGTSFPIDPAMTARLLGFDGTMPHAQDAVASRDAIFELVSGATFLAITIGRMAHDFYAMTMHEVATLDLPDRIAITSSIMPQKKNMAALEHLKGRPAVMSGALMAALAAQKGVPFSHTQDAGAEALRWVWDALDEALHALPVARIVVVGAEPRKERMIDLARSNFSTVTDLADLLVRESGLSFREAHHVAGRVVRHAVDHDKLAHEIDAEMLRAAARESIGRPVDVEEGALARALDPGLAALGREYGGGPGTRTAEALLEARQVRLEQDKTKFARRDDAVRRAAGELDRVFSELANSGQRTAAEG